MKLGKKIFALLLTAVCLIGVLPLTVFGATEEVCYPAVGVWCPKYRFSKSSGAFIEVPNFTSLVLPIPDSTTIVISGLEGAPSPADSYCLDSNFQFVGHLNRHFDEATGTITITNLVAEAIYVTIPFPYGTPYGGELHINDTLITMLEGSYTLARPAYCEDIVVPDPPTNGVQIQPILDMWDDILLLNATPLTDFYTQLVEPMGLIIGIPIMMALIGIIIFAIGGKKR